MGGLLSKASGSNTVNNMINAGISIMTSTTQSCYTSAANVQGLSFSNITGNIDLEHIDWNQLVVLDSKCMQSATSSAAIQQQVDSKLSEMAKAIAGSLSLGQTDTNNLINASIDMSQKIVMAFGQSCKDSTSNSQTINFNGAVGNITLGYFNWQQKLEITTRCVFDAVMNTDSAQQITQIIDSSASSKNEGLGDILKLVLIVLAVIAGFALIAVVVVGPKLLTAPPEGGPPPIVALAAMA